MTTHRATCQCGALVLEAEGDPDFVIACNCRACQRRTGSAFGTGAYFRKDRINIAGAAKGWKRTADSGRGLENFFCPDCGTTLYWTLDMRPDHMGVAYGNFAVPPRVPERAIWTQEQHDWVSFPDDWPTYEKGSPEPN